MESYLNNNCLDSSKEKKLAVIEVYAQLDKEVNVEQTISFEEQFETSVEYVGFLIRTNFNKFMSILYRVDVSEEKLKKNLQENKHTPTCQVIATMLLERELEKRKWRTLYKQKRKYE
ncbi:hypothetical protein CAPN004_21970 [Capnocytophaga cynodegmi]|uniref:hypothetical protein n=1 Tax=Capnocytophaga cynodegmi TaxID=28189 RepID=UPI001ACAE003|nr:hypothetical protein [Capnocytophaga cynodegmi]GIM53167.1 hypothetical protein CAPN004_21970 [Capnocytophaga cynodegmi]